MSSTWPTEDPEMLRAALEIFDTWDVADENATSETLLVSSQSTDSDGSTARSDSGEELTAEPLAFKRLRSDLTSQQPRLEISPLNRETSATVVPTVLKPSTMASTHYRRRQEVKYLREEVRELESHLATLGRAKSTVDALTAAAGAQLRHQREGANVWQDIAHRQLQVRLRVETEQLRLKKTLADQMKIARGLVKLMQRAQRTKNGEGYRQIKCPRPMVDRGVRSLRNDQSVCIDDVHARLDTFFVFPKFHDGTKKFTDMRIREDRQDQYVIEWRETWLVPFGVDQVMDSIWGCAVKKYDGENCKPEFDVDTHQVVKNETELNARYVATALVGSFPSQFDGQFSVRRFEQTNLSPPAIVAVISSTPAGSETVDIHAQEECCIRVLPGSCPGWENCAHPVAQVQCSQRFGIRFEDKASVRLLCKEMLSKVKDWSETMHESAETLLLTNPSR